MTPAVVALHLAGSRTVRRLFGCGCLGVGALVALPVLLIASMTAGAFGTLTGQGTAQSDPFSVVGAAGMVMGTAEPLPPGSFTVAQGFGCTTIALEPPPPPPYVCPPDAAHADATRFHSGVDLAAATGTSVFAVVAGIAHVIASPAGFGLHLVLLPTGAAGGISYLYGHLSSVLVEDGAVVTEGAALGLVGSTGNSTGPHLHFEVDVGSIPINPCAAFPSGYLVPAGVAAAGCVATGL